MRYVVDPPVTPELKDDILRLWADVTNAGGAVGFVPPVAPEDVRPELLKHLVAMAEERVRLVAALDEEGHVVGTAFLTYNAHRLMRHWVWLYTVMVHPSLQGRGAGRGLMAAAAEAARADEGIEAIRLTCRGGTGVDAFYASCGYREVGRVPGAIRAGAGDFRDDITMWLPLGGAAGEQTEEEMQ
ncbi:GNAT family N-acetyltransferase [Streptomyces sp. HNM0574]|nr:GNAT family N-acetyltransferase [Streptomyces sp. HNM0574]